MASRWLPSAAVMSVLLVFNTAVAAQENQACVTWDRQQAASGQKSSTLNAVMALLGGAGSVAVLLVPGEVHWAFKLAAVAGLGSAVWGAAEAVAATPQNEHENINFCVQQSNLDNTLKTVSIAPTSMAENAKTLQYKLSSTMNDKEWQQLTLPPSDIHRIDWEALLNPPPELGRLSSGTNVGSIIPISRPPLLPSEIFEARKKAQQFAMEARKSVMQPVRANSRACDLQSLYRDSAFSADCNLWNGVGVFRFRNGDRFAGEFKNGRPNGFGIYIFRNGLRYVGEMQDGKENGWGIESNWPLTGIRDMGYWQNGKLLQRVQSVAGK